MLYINKSNVGCILLLKSVFSSPIRSINNRIRSGPILETTTTTKKSFICPWYCYPIVIFSILIGLILITICISAFDYGYLQKHSELKNIKQKSIVLENKDNEDKQTIDSISIKSEEDDTISINSNDSQKI
ncbi:unnamed protein product [Adineta steineri]|uniref:Uncharacterized protein n=1 Tax=Adineta steineri TaxID=433720 RepID=A0A814AP70_9BILA|nr:unnamed protein product [Adineta steineri]CAF0914849.1 unnamed protein product [Adineta steineri]CAF3906464.1 unnamed protein product [Adineta steineri]CAF3906500.1 unnamed protein product [Adineta steineri]